MADRIRFTNRRTPGSEADLEPHQIAQLEAFSVMWDGVPRAASELIAQLRQRPLQVWDVVDDRGTVRYELWLDGSDSGLVFHAGGCRQLGPIVQFGFTSEDPEVWAELAAAEVPTGEEAACLRMIDFSSEEP